MKLIRFFSVLYVGGIIPFFLMNKQKIINLLEDAVSDTGYEIVHVMVRSSGDCLCILMENQETGTLSLKECQFIHRKIENILWEAELWSNHWTLEVSSPGLDRPLVKPAHYQRFLGKNVQISLKIPLEGNNSVMGCLEKTNAQGVVIQTDKNEVFLVEWDSIKLCRLVPEIPEF
jgi:ribosome maturation factor RimP